MNDLLLRAVVAIPWLILAGCGESSGRTGGADDGSLTCAGCTLELARSVQLGSELPAGSPRFEAALARLPDGSYVVGPTYQPGAVARYDSGGQFRGAIGQFGEGPGEMEEVYEPVPWGGDSIAILHDLNSVSIFDSGGGYGRTMILEPESFLTSDISEFQSGTFLARRTGMAGGGGDAALREYSSGAEPVRGYGPKTALGAGRVYAGFAAAGDTIWAVDTNRYEIDIFRRGAEALGGTVARETEWFPPDPPRNEWGGRPSVQDVTLYAPGRLLVLLRRPRPDFEFTPRPPAAGPASAGAGSLDQTDFLERYEQVIELVDLEAGRLVAQLQVEDYWVLGFLDGDEVYTYQYDEDSGEVGVLVWEVRLVGGG